MKRNGPKILASALVIILLLVIQFARPSRGGLWLQTFYESLHVPLFGIIAVCVLFITPQSWSNRNRLLAMGAAVIGLSLLSEVAQIPTGRDASVKDLISDWLGAAGFVAAGVVFSRSFSVPRGRGRYLVVLGIVLIAWPLLPLAKVSAAYWERTQMLPSLVRFDSRFAGTFFHLQNAQLGRRGHSIAEAGSASILLQDGPWPGIIFHDLWPNWQPYTALIVEFENPETTELPINIRVHDREHRSGEQPYDDRFNRRIELAQGLQTIQIALTDIQGAPVGRQMNMAEIDGLVIFATKQESGRRFILHEIRLE